MISQNKRFWKQLFGVFRFLYHPTQNICPNLLVSDVWNIRQKKIHFKSGGILCAMDLRKRRQPRAENWSVSPGRGFLLSKLLRDRWSIQHNEILVDAATTRLTALILARHTPPFWVPELSQHTFYFFLINRTPNRKGFYFTTFICHVEEQFLNNSEWIELVCSGFDDPNFWHGHA